MSTSPTAELCGPQTARMARSVRRTTTTKWPRSGLVHCAGDLDRLYAKPDQWGATSSDSLTLRTAAAALLRPRHARQRQRTAVLATRATQADHDLLAQHFAVGRPGYSPPLLFRGACWSRRYRPAHAGSLNANPNRPACPRLQFWKGWVIRGSADDTAGAGGAGGAMVAEIRKAHETNQDSLCSSCFTGDGHKHHS